MTSARVSEVWVYLARTPLLWLTLTLIAYGIADAIHRRLRRNPFANPVFIAVAIILVILVASGTPYQSYFDGAQFVHFLLGPATVALAVPLHRELGRMRARAVGLAVALLGGSAVAILTAVITARLAGASHESVMSMAPKSTTTPVAMGISEKLGGLPSLTAAIVIVTGIVGAIIGPPLLRRIKVRDQAAAGFSMGVAAHGIGTATAFQMGERAGAFSGLAMGLNALVTALLAPALVKLLKLG